MNDLREKIAKIIRGDADFIEVRAWYPEADAILALFEDTIKDAGRYRWLRDAPLYSAPVGSLIELWLFSRPTATAQAFDAAIDAAKGAE